jgi:hypothetical protein
MVITLCNLALESTTRYGPAAKKMDLLMGAAHKGIRQRRLPTSRIDRR